MKTSLVDGLSRQPTPGTHELAPPAAGRAEVVEECARVALREFIYETTHLSPEEEDGSHWCRISAETLRAGRAALAPTSPTGGQASSPVVTEAEPVAWRRLLPIIGYKYMDHRAELRAALQAGEIVEPLYAALPARAAEQAGGWQRVTNEMVEKALIAFRDQGMWIGRDQGVQGSIYWNAMSAALEAALTPAPPRAAEQPTPAVDGGRA